MSLRPEFVIAPPKRWLSINWQELWRYRDLFLVLAWRDISVRYKQTALGVVWAIFQPFITMIVFTFILVGMMIYYGVAPHLLGILILPALLGCSILSAMGMGLLLASLNVKYRDVRFALPFFIQIMLYVTPVIYPVKMLDNYPVVKGLMLWLNPISGVITNARACLLYT